MTVEESHTIAPRVQALLSQIDANDEAMNVRAALAISLARKLDEAIADDSATSAMAAPSISKELRATLLELVSSQDKRDSFVSSLFQ